MTMSEWVIETRGLGRRYGRQWAVKGLVLTVRKGAVYGLLGLNGAGKTTTFRMLLGLIRRSEGAVNFLGLDPARNGVALKRRVGYVGETHNFYEWMSVNEIFEFVAHYRKERWDKRFERSLRERFHLDGSKKLKALSKGMRAKVSLVLALAFHPEVLILDEPTGGLDPIARRDFFEGVLAEYQDTDRTILISSHLVNEISGLVDHVGILHAGQLIRDCPAEEFVSRIKRLRIVFSGEPPQTFSAEGLVRYSLSGHEAVGVTFDYVKDQTEQRIIAAGAREVEPISLNLEDAFIEFVGRREE
jgi:ABC-2 type transport system ATP-binding protein